MTNTCPECGEALDDSADYHCMLTHNCCKCCYDNNHFGEPGMPAQRGRYEASESRIEAAILACGGGK